LCIITIIFVGINKITKNGRNILKKLKDNDIINIPLKFIDGKDLL